MGQNVFSFEKYYQTQPPRTIEQANIGSVFEYLIFSGTPIYLAIVRPDGAHLRIDDPALLIESEGGALTFELPKIHSQLATGQELLVSFGYKRSRATFRAGVISVESTAVTIIAPHSLVMTNLRRNPRLVVERSLFKHGIRAQLQAQTSIGELAFRDCEIFEVSQFGASLFVSRDQGLILEGDRVMNLSVTQSEFRLFQCEGRVSRVDMKRSSPNLPNSYQVVVIFDEKKKPAEIPLERSAKRMPILDSKPCYFSAEHPFFPGRKIKGQVLELSSSGLSCILEGTPFPVVPGMRFPKCQLQLPFCPSRDLCFEVVHVDFRSDGETNQFKLGGVFINGSVELLKDISDYAQTTQSENIRDLSDEDLDLLWSFMFETNFIYQKKRRQIQHNSREILETYKRLLATDNPIVKKLVFKEDDEIKGHVSGVRFYDNTWLIQHLNALKASSASAGRSMVEGMMSFFYDRKATSRTSSRYTMSFFRPDNLYPALVFGESCRLMNDPQASVCHDFCFGLPIDAEASPLKGSIKADTQDVTNSLIDTLVGMKFLHFLRAVDLSSPNPLRPQVCAEFERLGLFRERHIVCAELEDNKVFALVELASPGLNLSELTNACFLFQAGHDRGILRSLSEQVIHFAEREYYQPKALAPVVLMPYGGEPPANVSWEKIYTCWITSTDVAPRFIQVVETIFSNLKTYISKWNEGRAISAPKQGDEAPLESKKNVQQS